MNTLRRSFWGGLGALAGASAIITAVLLVLEFNSLTVASRAWCAGLVAAVVVGFAAWRARRRRQDGKLMQ